MVFPYSYGRVGVMVCLTILGGLTTREGPEQNPADNEMACKCFVIPRQRMLMLLTLVLTFTVQGFVEGWTLSKPEMKIRLPVDFPTHQAFYKIVALPEITDSSDLQVEFHIPEKMKLFVQSNGRGDAYRKKLLDIGRYNGTLWLHRRVADMDFYKNAPEGKEKLCIEEFS
ncbi:hypothetical protein HNY73_023028 [Argiope bruennichi]|uniref:Uncharacterized protein n=1 Tax=Argiope bruennichi TaxID=94029 RepID=A0A8T0E6H1_ARGBR|nr:hypothetical protein HNY73_023028 [Argiope bruennichi]